MKFPENKVLAKISELTVYFEFCSFSCFQGLKAHHPKIAFFTHGESSGATVQPLEGIGALCHK